MFKKLFTKSQLQQEKMDGLELGEKIKDHLKDMSRKRMQRLWISKGFVAEHRGMTMESVAVADSYFDDDPTPIEISFNGKVKTCQFHDIMLQFVI
ncbi:uncharacterized protein A4U43_C02F17870 [Asparagus officinalis]|uniref:Disease resistance protein winged helix domain-containing protein n=1 Tax=Asparagus officinalis TaxID=4686 RepID=A0A5P1FKV9_ASPOF|nr:uncharacterized protein A4U43_C02F17870 [Asparagus officinalis]